MLVAQIAFCPIFLSHENTLLIIALYVCSRIIIPCTGEPKARIRGRSVGLNMSYSSRSFESYIWIHKIVFYSVDIFILLLQFS